MQGLHDFKPDTLIQYCYSENNLREEIQAYKKDDNNALKRSWGSFYDTYEFIGNILGSVTFDASGNIINGSRYTYVRTDNAPNGAVSEMTIYKPQTETN